MALRERLHFHVAYWPWPPTARIAFKEALTETVDGCHSDLGSI